MIGGLFKFLFPKVVQRNAYKIGLQQYGPTMGSPQFQHWRIEKLIKDMGIKNPARIKSKKVNLAVDTSTLNKNPNRYNTKIYRDTGTEKLPNMAMSRGKNQFRQEILRKPMDLIESDHRIMELSGALMAARQFKNFKGDVRMMVGYKQLEKILRSNKSTWNWKPNFSKQDSKKYIEKADKLLKEFRGIQKGVSKKGGSLRVIPGYKTKWQPKRYEYQTKKWIPGKRRYEQIPKLREAHQIGQHATLPNVISSEESLMKF